MRSRVIPLACGWHPGLDGPFVVVVPGDDSDDDPVVHLENRRSGLFLHEREDVDAYQAAVEKVLRVTMTAADSAAAIVREAEKREREMDGNYVAETTP